MLQTVPAVIGPRFGSQLGGTAVHITGPCFDETDQITCIFDNQPGQTGFYVNNLTVICVSPSFDTIGWKDLTLMVTRDGNLAYATRSRFYASKLTTFIIMWWLEPQLITACNIHSRTLS